MAMAATPDYSSDDHNQSWPQAMSLSSTTIEARGVGHRGHSSPPRIDRRSAAQPPPASPLESPEAAKERLRRNELLIKIVGKLKNLEPRVPLLSFMTVGHDVEENDFIFHSLFGLPRRPTSSRIKRRDVLDRGFRREWLVVESPILRDRTINVLWGDSPGSDSTSNSSVHNASSKSRELHRLHRAFNNASTEALLSQKSIDVCLCVFDILEQSSAKDPSSVFEVPYRFFAKDFVSSGLTVVNNTALLVHKRLECQSPGCRCEEFHEKVARGPVPVQLSNRQQMVCSQCAHKKDRHILEDNRQLKVRKNKAFKRIERRMSSVFHGKTANVFEKGDSKGLKGVIKNIFDMFPDVGTKTVPFLESKYDDYFPDGSSKWFVDLWYRIFMRLDDESLYTFYMATDLQIELDIETLRKVLRRVNAAVERKYPPTEHERKIGV